MKVTEMQNVIEALRYMAEHGGYWYYGTFSGVWRLFLYGARSDSAGRVGFTQDELREFLKHYDELTDGR